MLQVRRKDSARDARRQIDLLVSEVSEKIESTDYADYTERRISHKKAQEAQKTTNEELSEIQPALFF